MGILGNLGAVGASLDVTDDAVVAVFQGLCAHVSWSVAAEPKLPPNGLERETDAVEYATEFCQGSGLDGDNRTLHERGNDFVCSLVQAMSE